ncbi:MAG: hypothetical protein VZR73_17305, partial [Acutalibacteraceae bacterium]|nr:hypothetical protein [Acutalibacteraceae bacterium]
MIQSETKHVELFPEPPSAEVPTIPPTYLTPNTEARFEQLMTIEYAIIPAIPAEESLPPLTEP